MKIQRSEASAHISEFNLTEVGKEKVKLNDLIKSLKKSTHQVAIKNQLKNASKKKALEVPLSKPQADRIKRTLAYNKASEEVEKWDSIVKANRTADQIIFPLKQPEFRLETTEEIAKRFQTKNALEEEVSKLLGSSENVLDQEKELTAAEEKALKAMSLTEAKARHAELRKMRALLSHKEAKARRQKKIKSKKYHRILKKEKMKKLMKEFEELQKTDPTAAEEKLKEADKLRILERMTLKHKSTGKWAKQQKMRAKYNKESRDALKEQISLSRNLTEKVIPVSSPTCAALDLDEEPQAQDAEDGDLLNMYISSSGVDMEKMKKSVTSVKAGKIKKSKAKSIPRDVVPVNELEEAEDGDNFLNETTERKQTLEDFESHELDNEPSASQHVVDSAISSLEKIKETADVKSKPKASVNYVSEIDFSTETKFLDSLVPDDITLGDEGIDDAEEDKMNIMQAFADEDLISEFKEDKRAILKKERPQGIDLFLPGWGSWGGPGIKVSKRKRRRFYIKPLDVPVRKDHTLGNVIINEEKDVKAAAHQVSDLPFPYKSPSQFHSIIRQPIGNTWNPETSFKKLIAPQVVTKLGKIIDPMDAEDVVLEKKTIEKNPRHRNPRFKNKTRRKEKEMEKANVS